MVVEPAREVHRMVALERPEDVAQCLDELPQPGDGRLPRHREAPRDVRLYLGGEAEGEATVTGALEVPRLHRHAHRVASKCKDYVGPEQDTVRARRGGGEGKGGVGDDLAGPHTGEADPLGGAGGLRRTGEAVGGAGCRAAWAAP